jgi:hypothetical protein
MEVVFRPSVPDNLEHWQVFDDDAQILRFMQGSKEFSNSQINFLVDSMNLEVIDFPNNTLPKGCIPLEQMFDRHDIYRGKPVEDHSDKVLEFNIGTKIEPRMVKIGKGTTKAKRSEILDLIRQFKDVFTWTYDDLKAYRSDVIQHTIPLVDGAKPFRQNLRHINPKLAPQISEGTSKDGRCWYHSPYQVFFMDVKPSGGSKEEWRH